MGEFNEVMRHWRRMCMSIEDKAASEYRPCMQMCPVGTNPVCGEVCESTSEDVDRFEAAVMQWAAEHPEPVYPTWGEWLKDRIGITTLDGFPTPDQVCDIIMHTYISADDAQKLGIKPKEG